MTGGPIKKRNRYMKKYYGVGFAIVFLLFCYPAYLVLNGPNGDTIRTESSVIAFLVVVSLLLVLAAISIYAVFLKQKIEEFEKIEGFGRKRPIFKLVRKD